MLAELAGKSARAIAAELNARGVATPSGGRWHAETVIRVQRRLEPERPRALRQVALIRKEAEPRAT